jgi:hypothetical protein
VKAKHSVNYEHFVGNYRLGFRYVRLVVDNGTANGSVKLIPEDGGTAIVYIGIQIPWENAVTTLLHELYEAALIGLNTRYEQCPTLSNESSDFIFVMAHNQLGEAHEHVGHMLVSCLPALSKAYRKYSTYED